MDGERRSRSPELRLNVVTVLCSLRGTFSPLSLHSWSSLVRFNFTHQSNFNFDLIQITWRLYFHWPNWDCSEWSEQQMEHLPSSEPTASSGLTDLVSSAGGWQDKVIIWYSFQENKLFEWSEIKVGKDFERLWVSLD